MDTQRRSQAFRASAPPLTLAVAAVAVVPLLAARMVAEAARYPWSAARVAAIVACVAAAVALVIPAILPTTVTVGADGVLVEWLGQRTLVPIGDLLGVSLSDEAGVFGKAAMLHLQRRAGPPIPIQVGTLRVYGRGAALADWAILKRRTALAERIHEALAQRDAHLADAVRLPERGSGSAKAWFEALRTVGRPGGYRAEAAPDAARLWRVVEDPAQAPSARAAAAVVLGSSLDEAGRQRLRVAAAATAAPKLRIALEAAARSDDARLTEALAELDDESARAAQASRGRIT
jgi:hypothetical protein